MGGWRGGGGRGGGGVTVGVGAGWRQCWEDVRLRMGMEGGVGGGRKEEGGGGGWGGSARKRCPGGGDTQPLLDAYRDGGGEDVALW